MSGYAFISYAREDGEYVEKLAKHLQAEGVNVWFDAHLMAGSRYDDEIVEKIGQCSAFILVMSPAGRKSNFVRDEFDYAMEQERDLMPISLSGEKFFGLGPIQFELVQDSALPGDDYVKRLRRLVGEGELQHEMKAHQGHVRSVAYPSGNPALVASAGPEMCVRIWNPGTGELVREIQGATWPVSFSRDGDYIATGGPNHAVHVWNTETGELIKQVGAHKKALTSVAVSPDGSVLVTGSGDTSEHLWDLRTGELIRTLTGRVKPASPLVISPDGTWLVAPTESGSRLGAGLWDMQTGNKIGSLKGHKGPVHDVTVSWDGRFAATAGEDHTARIWNAKTGDEIFVLGAHLKAVRAVAFSPNGYRLATGSTDQTIRLWDATTGAHIMCITNRAGGIYDLAYSPDGRTLASGHGDGAIRIWKA
ncbi:toll/interleukin-1 receptor domain-containing protein [Catelliglobosispora koreensis]|uniref:toll/interleukin-1 receptor domain-containing protein n=1 Tax=Catelliglobosispora koreensis TaxID=129052 RepID=UPI000369B5EC|nr:TIR domain-containing protein [Catelliglobosispora koreensis]